MEKIFSTFIGAIIFIVLVTAFLPVILEAIGWIIAVIGGAIALLIATIILIKVLRRRSGRREVHHHHYHS